MVSELSATPILYVRDIERAAEFYGVKLGCALMYSPHGDGVSLTVLFRSGDQLRFKQAGNGVFHVRPSGSPHWHASVQAPDVDALAADFAAHGVPFVTPLGDRPGGLRGFEIADPDGNILFFAQPQTNPAADPEVAAPQSDKAVPMRPAAEGASWPSRASSGSNWRVMRPQPPDRR